MIATQQTIAGNLTTSLEAHKMMRDEMQRMEQVRASFIDQVCDQYRQKGEIRLIKPERSPDLHLFLREEDGKFHCVGHFDEKRMGIVFVSR